MNCSKIFLTVIIELMCAYVLLCLSAHHKSIQVSTLLFTAEYKWYYLSSLIYV
jgi:hypothetical protein